MGNKVVRLSANANTLIVDDTKYKLTPGLLKLITYKHPRAGQWKTNDYQVYKSLVAQAKVKSFPNRAGTARPHATWKSKHMIRKMVIPGERITEVESEDSDDTDSVESYPAIVSIGYIDRTAPGVLKSDSDISSPGMLSTGILSSDSGISSPSPLHTRSDGKAKKTKGRVPFL